MWKKQEDQEGLEVQRHDFDESFTWEEQAFAEDTAAVWPPRSYSCSFCRREFRSAQALGGHMNVHRRDRARLKQSPNINITLPYHLPNPNPKTTYSVDRVISCGDRSDSNMGKDENLRISCCPRVRDNEDRVGIGILDEGQPSLDFGFGRPWPTSGLFDYDAPEEAAEAITGCKRRKTDDETTIQFHVKKSSSLPQHQHQHQHHHRHRIQSEVIGLGSSSLHDLDLELRLGGLSNG